MKKNSKGLFFAKIDRGRVRVTNEDQAAALTNSNGDILLAVCDGMGGHQKGDYASRLAINMLQEAFRNKKSFKFIFLAKIWLKNVINEINKTIYSEGFNNEDYKDMGTTLICCLLIKESLIVANVGDSRAYNVRYDSLKRLSEDQTYVNYLYRTGQISIDEIKTRIDRHVLMNAIGICPHVDADIRVYPNIGNPVLLCSDGLYNNISEREILMILKSDDRIESKVETLINVANSNGGSDNIAISYWERIDND